MSSSTDAERQPSAASEGRLALSLVSLSGKEVATLSAEPSWQLGEVLRAAGIQPSITEQTRILLGEEELCGARTLAELEATDGAQLSLVTCQRGYTLVVVGQDGWVRILCAETGTCLWAIRGERAFFFATFSPDHAAVLTLEHFPSSYSSGSRNGYPGQVIRRQMRLWSTSTRRCCKSFAEQSSMVRAAIFSPDGGEVLTREADCVRLWSVASGACLRSFAADGIRSVSFSPDGERILTSSGRSTSLWCKTSGDCLRAFHGNVNGRLHAAFSRDGFLVLHGEQLELWSSCSSQCSLRRELRPAEGVQTAALSPDGELLIAAVHGDMAELWSTGTAQCLWRIHEPVLSAAFSQDGQSIATAGHNGKITVWSAEAGDCLQSWTGHSAREGYAQAVFELAFSQDGLLLLTQSTLDGKAKLWHWTRGECLFTWPSRQAAFSR